MRQAIVLIIVGQKGEFTDRQKDSDEVGANLNGLAFNYVTVLGQAAASPAN